MADPPRHGAPSARRRLPAAAAAACLAITLVAPLWHTRMEAPQYKGDEALDVQVYAGRVTGDLDEIQTLNQYIGVHLPLDTPELRASPWVLGFLLLISVGWIVVPASWSRRTAGVLFVALVATAAVGTVALHRRLYEIGHDRERGVFSRVDDFMPPLIGRRKIANFTVYTSPQAGTWTFLLAAGLAGVSAFRRQPGRGEAASQGRSGAGSGTQPPPVSANLLAQGAPRHG